jgi:hypothetical protein
MDLQAAQRSSVSYRVVFGVMVVTLAAAFMVGLYIHRNFTRHRARAALHLPAGIELAYRLDTEQTVGFDAMKQHLLPLMELGKRGPEPRAKVLERKTTIELEVDVREIVYAEVAHGGWLVLAAGMIRSDSEVLDGLVRMAAEEGLKAHVQGALVLFDNGWAAGVAEDATLVLASSAQLGRQALKVAPAPYARLLQKPGSVLGWVSYRPQDGARANRRCWVSVEPGTLLPAYVELSGGGQAGGGVNGNGLSAGEAVTDCTGIAQVGSIQRAPAPRGVVAASIQLTPAQFEHIVAQWARRLGEHLSGSP